MMHNKNKRKNLQNIFQSPTTLCAVNGLQYHLLFSTYNPKGMCIVDVYMGNITLFKKNHHIFLFPKNMRKDSHNIRVWERKLDKNFFLRILTKPILNLHYWVVMAMNHSMLNCFTTICIFLQFLWNDLPKKCSLCTHSQYSQFDISINPFAVPEICFCKFFDIRNRNQYLLASFEAHNCLTRNVKFQVFYYQWKFLWRQIFIMQKTNDIHLN
jgi:hypothetical protein